MVGGRPPRLRGTGGRSRAGRGSRPAGPAAGKRPGSRGRGRSGASRRFCFERACGGLGEFDEHGTPQGLRAMSRTPRALTASTRWRDHTIGRLRSKMFLANFLICFLMCANIRQLLPVCACRPACSFIGRAASAPMAQRQSIRDGMGPRAGGPARRQRSSGSPSEATPFSFIRRRSAEMRPRTRIVTR